jgi:peptidoglycan/LPS O-acetylase OafA/YrhL
MAEQQSTSNKSFASRKSKPAVAGGAGNVHLNETGKSTSLALPERLPSLDGWRAICILMVLVEHSRHTFDFPQKITPLVAWSVDANLAVRFFFVISGFLITYLMLREHACTGALSLRRFYARRALRILPVYFTFLAVALGLQIFTVVHRPLATWIANLTFTSNFARDPNGPLTKFFTMHLWSIAIEEQFYLFWPVVLVAAGLQNTRRLLHILMVPIIATPVCKSILYTHYAILFPPPFDILFRDFSSFFYFDSLALGCLSAVLFARYNDVLKAMLSRRASANVAISLLFIIAPHVLGRLSIVNIFTFVAGNSFQAIGFTILLLHSVYFPKFFRPLNWPPMRQIGVLSYSIYIWHMLFCEWPKTFGLPNIWFMSFYFWIIPALAVSALSFYCLEKPFMAFRARLSP